MAASSTSQVRVGVRIRPLTSKETSEGGSAVVEGNAFDRTVSIARRKFTYDSVFHSNVTQSDLYDDVAPPLLDAFLNGFNATVLAYGQTGSGKTYTMGSEAHGDQVAANYSLPSSSTSSSGGGGESLNETDGLIPRFLSDIFTMLIQRKEESERAVLKSPQKGQNDDNTRSSAADALIDFSISASFLEVYGEDIFCLLDEDRKSLPIREDSNGEVIVKGLRDTPIGSDADAMNVLNTGTMHRTTAATLMNCTSSRSHAVFTINLQQTTRSAEGVDVTASSRFTFVDLAGSERMKKTGAEGERLREGIKINEGLLALGNVINALADDERLAKGEKVHVPYRQSKLTRLLQEALGGNSQTLFIACVSPSDTNANESLSTLHYANRARNIQNRISRNVDSTVVELQRLRTLTNLLKCELIKQRFASVDDPEAEKNDSESSSANGQDIGVVNDDILRREDVAAYMKQIDDKVAELSGGTSFSSVPLVQTNVAPTNAAATRPPLLLPSSLSSADNISGNTSGGESISMKDARSSIDHQNGIGNEDSFIFDIDPEEDMQLIDQLLELQQNDSRFKTEQKVDKERLSDMEGEIEAQEGQLLQLREHLQVYHNMKDKYERLMCEVHSLEGEKDALAKELEKAQVDPTKGCSRAIKTKLQKVEASLARARSETRKHQQLYRKAEAEAQKCKVLERKIHDLKHAKVNLVKKQREVAAKHKEFTNQKTREINALKRKEKTADKKISKMGTECQQYKTNYERTRSHCEKLSDKLKQTESQLMKLITRKRRASVAVRQSNVHGAGVQQHLVGVDEFAPVNEEVKSIEFMLLKTIENRVTLSQNKDAYESMVVEQGKLMQEMTNEAKSIRELKKECQTTDSDIADEIVAQIKEHEENVQDLQLNIELLENDMEQLRAKYPSIEDSAFGEDTKDEDGPALKMIAKLGGPVLRTILLNLLQSYEDAELQLRNVKIQLIKKESTLKSFEDEILMQDEKIDTLSKSLDRRRRLSTSEGGDPADIIQKLEEEIQVANTKLDSCLADKAGLQSQLDETRSSVSSLQVDCAQAEERLALFHSQQKLTESTEETEQMLKQLQDVLAEIGVSMDDRENRRAQLENCVEDACSRMLDEAMNLRDEKLALVSSRRDRLAEIYASLGLDAQGANDLHTMSQPLNNQLASLDRQLKEVEPQYDAAVERCNELMSQAERLMSDLQPVGKDRISDSLRILIQQNQTQSKRRQSSQIIPANQRASMEASREARAKLSKDIEQMLQTIDETSSFIAEDDNSEPVAQHIKANGIPSAPGSLSASFLDSCEQDIKQLRLVKSDRLLSNTEKCKEVGSITEQMHVGASELTSIVLHGLKKDEQGIPDWWDERIAQEALGAASKNGSVMVNESFTKHLDILFDVVQAISRGRELLSTVLKDVISDSHSALLATAEGCGMDVNELSRSLHDALLHIPPLSKQHVTACVDEMQMLATAADSVYQSEVETLTVLWEGLNVTSSERGRFWTELGDMTSELEMTTKSPFDAVVEECPAEVEEWVLKSSTEAAKVQRMLGVRIFKLRKIHEEVERLKLKQDEKNKIMSLNNELKILDAKLVEFEEKAGNKQRLLDKKANSSSLLDEERFRKQMQGMFSSKLESLRQLLDDWESKEGRIEDYDMLSEVVKSMLENSHRIDAWMNEKTRLMHLRTTTSSKNRTTPQLERVAPGRARARSASSNPGIPKRNAHIHKRCSSATDSRQKSAQKRGVRTSTEASRGKKRPPMASHSSSRPPNPMLPTKPGNKTSSERQKQRKGLSATTNNSLHAETSSKHTSSVQVDESKGSQGPCPFGNLLAESPKQKENSAHF